MEPAVVPPSPFKPFIQLKRDLGMILGGFTGRTPRPFHERSGKHRVGISPRPFVVREVIRETADAVTLCLEDPTGSAVSFLPGQFFTLLMSLGGEELRRAYSASSAPGGGVRITVKRVPEGRVSSYLNDHVQAGALLRMLGPSGEFVARSAPELVLIAGGSGITPMRAIIEESLLGPSGPQRKIQLIYGNRSERDVIFRAELRGWAARFPEHFSYVEVLSEPEEAYAGPRSLLTRDCLGQLLGEFGGRADFMLCGPEGMLVEARAALETLGVPRSRIREERFTQPHLRQRAAALPQTPQPVRLRLGKQAASFEFDVAPGRTLLESALAAGADVPYSCAMGGCGRCKVKLVSGEIAMDEPNCLSEEERQAGYVLGCVGRPLGPCEIEVER